MHMHAVRSESNGWSVQDFGKKFETLDVSTRLWPEWY